MHYSRRGKGWCLSVASFVCTWEEKRGMNPPTASEQVYPVHSTIKGCINYLGRRIASCEEQLQIVLEWGNPSSAWRSCPEPKNSFKMAKKKRQSHKVFIGGKVQHSPFAPHTGPHRAAALESRHRIICTGGDSICTQAIKVHLTLHKTHKKAYLRCSVMDTILELAMHLS